VLYRRASRSLSDQAGISSDTIHRVLQIRCSTLFVLCGYLLLTGIRLPRGLCVVLTKAGNTACVTHHDNCLHKGATYSNHCTVHLMLTCSHRRLIDSQHYDGASYDSCAVSGLSSLSDAIMKRRLLERANVQSFKVSLHAGSCGQAF
jgi:hypothetical protein